ncbi:MAG: hypothetical protein RLZZ127_18 [Planctomycetota bacterium]|jgi:hypothetical protein
MIWPGRIEQAGRGPVRAAWAVVPALLAAAALPLAMTAPWPGDALPPELVRDALALCGWWPAHLDAESFRAWQPWSAVLVVPGWAAWLWAALWLPAALGGAERRLGPGGLLALLAGALPVAAVGGLLPALLGGDPRPVGTGPAAAACAAFGALATAAPAARLPLDAAWTTLRRAGIATVVRLDPVRAGLLVLVGDGVRALVLGEPAAWPALAAAGAAGAAMGLVLRR